MTDELEAELNKYPPELEPFGFKTMPPPWYKRVYWRMVYRLSNLFRKSK